ncbi:MAG: hypothetical protein LQ350_006151 [Teloschistes chrysophthalmus]|nr:MAG: hypothetical protein LQ350_006151 [Niorma chrysophthalma]
MDHQQHTPASAHPFQLHNTASQWHNTSMQHRSPPSAASSNNTYLMPTSPSKKSKGTGDNYKPKPVRTCGQRPACLVNASVTYCGNDQIYAFGGFDQYTDEVYNHVLKLDLKNLQWTLVDNYGDIPGVRMGHTACLWQGSKLLVYGGENEHREYLTDVVILDLKTAHWTQPEVRGPIPKGRARHAAAVYDDKLYIVGGLAGNETYTLNEICYLDLKTWTWSRSWSFVPRFDHSAWVWGGRIWVFGGLDPSMERTGEIWWLDLKSSPAFKTAPTQGTTDSLIERQESSSRPQPIQVTQQHQHAATGSSGYTANSSSVQVRASSSFKPVAPGAMSSVRFVSGPNVPSQSFGTHFHVYSSGALLDFVTPASTIRPSEYNLSALELDTLQWQRLAEGPEIFDPSYRWHYCTLNEDGTKAWLLGCPSETPETATGFEEYLSDVLALDLRKYGLLGNDQTREPLAMGAKLPASDTHAISSLSSLGADLSSMFDQSPEFGSDSDFIVTAEKDGHSDEYDSLGSPTSSSVSSPQFLPPTASTSAPIYVHKLILRARWPHFTRVFNAQMAEFHTKKMHIPEPYGVVRAFLYYLYTDSISPHAEYCPSLDRVAGLLVMANVYDMPRLRLLCLHRLSRELDVEHAAVVWERAGTAGEDWLQRRAASYCLTHWGRIVRTIGFRQLSRQSMMDLCEVIDVEGRVVGGDELELVGGLGGARFGVGGLGREPGRSRQGVMDFEDTDATSDDNEGMEIT